MLWAYLFVTAFAASPDQVVAQVAVVESLRAQRVEKGAPHPSAADIRRAAQGSMVTGVDDGRAWAVLVMDLSIGKLWAGLNDETRHPGYTAVAYSELLSGRVCQSGRHVLQYLPVPFIDDRWWITILRNNAPLDRGSGGAVRELYWRSSIDPAEVTSDAGRKILSNASPIGSTRGAWFLVAIDSFSTYVEYYSKSDPGADVPKSITSRLAVRSLKNTIEAMEDFAKEGHPVCPVY